MMHADETPDRATLVRSAYEAWNTEGLDRFAEFLSDDVTVEDAPEVPDAGVARGLVAVVRRLDEVAQAVGGGSVEILGVETIGEAVLLTMMWNLDAADGAEVHLGEVLHLVDVDGDRISRIRVFLDRGSVDRAVEAG
jgi:ketosteroid isomerase-like protein